MKKLIAVLYMPSHETEFMSFRSPSSLKEIQSMPFAYGRCVSALSQSRDIGTHLLNPSKALIDGMLLHAIAPHFHPFHHGYLYIRDESVCVSRAIYI